MAAGGSGGGRARRFAIVAAPLVVEERRMECLPERTAQPCRRPPSAYRAAADTHRCRCAQCRRRAGGIERDRIASAGGVSAWRPTNGRYRFAGGTRRRTCSGGAVVRTGLCRLLRAVEASGIQAAAGRGSGRAGRTPRCADQYRATHAHPGTSASEQRGDHCTNPARAPATGLEPLSIGRCVDVSFAAACGRRHLPPHHSPDASA